MKSFKLFTLIIAVAILWGLSLEAVTLLPEYLLILLILLSPMVATPRPAVPAITVAMAAALLLAIFLVSVTIQVAIQVTITRFTRFLATSVLPKAGHWTPVLLSRSPTYGANVLTISNNTTATLVASSPCAGAAGPVYLYSNSPNLYYCDPTNGETQATDLIVQTGATLTLPGNYTALAGEYGGGTSSAQFLFPTPSPLTERLMRPPLVCNFPSLPKAISFRSDLTAL